MLRQCLFQIQETCLGIDDTTHVDGEIRRDGVSSIYVNYMFDHNQVPK